MTLREEVMALPFSERLPYALELLDELSGNQFTKQIWLKKTYGLAMQESNLFLALNNNSPRVMTKEALFKAICGNSDVELKIVDVLICKIRKKGLKIVTHWGVGYSVDEKIEVGEMNNVEEEKSGKPWTADNDNDLIFMVKNSSGLRSMAYELGRSERSVSDRIRILRAKGKLK